MPPKSPKNVLVELLFHDFPEHQDAEQEVSFRRLGVPKERSESGSEDESDKEGDAEQINTGAKEPLISTLCSFRVSTTLELFFPVDSVNYFGDWMRQGYIFWYGILLVLLLGIILRCKEYQKFKQFADSLLTRSSKLTDIIGQLEGLLGESGKDPESSDGKRVTKSLS